QRTDAAVILRDLDTQHGRWKVRAGRHPIPDLIEVALQVLLQDRRRLAIHARSSLVRLYPLIRFPDKLLRNYIRLGTRHQFLPVQIDQFPTPERAGSFAPPAFTGFVATTSPSAPPPRIGTLILMAPPLGFLPSHRGGRFPRSAHAPALGS